MPKRLSLLLMFCLLALPLHAQNTKYEIALERIEAARLSGATDLDLSGLELTELPPEIGQLSSLRGLFLGSNQLIVLPPEIGQLTQLEQLELPHNRLTDLPPEIGRLSQLCHLDLSNNDFQELPIELSQINCLTGQDSTRMMRPGLYVRDNPLITPPQEVLWQGTPAVLDYLREQAWYHTRQLLLSAAGGVGLLASVILLARWRYRRLRKPKKKNTAL